MRTLTKLIFSFLGVINHSKLDKFFQLISGKTEIASDARVGANRNRVS